MKKQEKNEAAYNLMLETYKAKGVETIEQAYAEKKFIKDKAWKFTAIIAAIVALLIILFFEYTVFWVMLAIAALVWIWLSASYGFKFIDRYIMHEIKKDTAN